MYLVKIILTKEGTMEERKFLLERALKAAGFLGYKEIPKKWGVILEKGYNIDRGSHLIKKDFSVDCVIFSKGSCFFKLFP